MELTFNSGEIVCDKKNPKLTDMGLNLDNCNIFYWRKYGLQIRI